MMERLTIDEAIAQEIELYEIAKDRYKTLGLENCKRSAEEHKQYVAWLKELKGHRERGCNHINEALYDKGYSDGYNKGLEYFVMLFKSKTSMENSLVDEIAEQLKAGEAE